MTDLTEGEAKYIQGIDISDYQWPRGHGINFDEAAAYLSEKSNNEKQSFVFVKATQGVTGTTHHFLPSIWGFREAGIKVGAYHFLMDTSDPVKQAEHFDSVYKPQPDDLPPFVDVEADGASNPSAEYVLTWCDRYKELTGIIPIIYVSPGYAATNHFAVAPKLGEYPLYVADYNKREEPMKCPPWDDWAFWQYTSKLSIPGIPTLCDGVYCKEVSFIL